jgi:MFS family permease
MNRIRTCLYLSVFVIMGLSDAVVPILPKLADETFVQSMIFSAYFAGALVSMIPLGMLADRYGNTRFILLSIVYPAQYRPDNHIRALDLLIRFPPCPRVCTFCRRVRLRGFLSGSVLDDCEI